MTVRRAVVLLTLGVIASSGRLAAASLPRTFSLSAENLAAARERLALGDATLQPALQQLRADAERALRERPVSVMDKSRMPPSGDKHDYLSQAPYFWPDPTKKDGLPYLRRDGERNPEVDRGTDRPALGRMLDAVQTLSLGWFFFRDQKYALHAGRFVRAWFVDPTTYMNPHLDYAQYTPGVNTGRGIGLIETAHLGEICDAIALLAGSGAWSDADTRAFRTWLEAYFAWLTTSKNGRDEAAAENNHGTWYDAQAAHLALVLGKDDVARRVLEAGLKRRLEFEIEPDGGQPRELARTKSLGYSTMNLQAMFTNARLAAFVGVDWWQHESVDHRSLLHALDYLLPYADPAKPWPRRDIGEMNRGTIVSLAAEGMRHWDDPRLADIVGKFGLEGENRAARWHLLLNSPPPG